MLHAHIRARGFGTLVTWVGGTLEANHLPFLLDADTGAHGVLRCHVARANRVWMDADGDTEALVIFHGPDAYVSPNWYPGKATSGHAVPTWNYLAVHAYGTLRVMEDRAWLRAHLEALTDRHEGGRETPWRMSDAPGDYLERMMAAVVGIEIAITRLQGKAKLSQNRSAEDRAGVIRGLKGEPGEAPGRLADLMD